MLSGQTAASGSSSTSRERPQRVIEEEEEEEEPEFRDIHALSPPRAPQSYRRSRAGSRDSWGSRHTSIRSVGSDTAPSEPFPSMSREFSAGHGQGDGVSVGQVKKEEVECKIAAWQIAEVAKVNNRFKREEVVINGWEGDQVEKASAWLNKYERKLEEKRAKAMEKAQNEVAKARRKAEDKRASAEAKRGTKVARVLELANFMRAVGRAPTKRSFF